MVFDTEPYSMDAEELKERRRARYENMTLEQSQKRREYQAAWMRKHRAQLREQAKCHTLAEAPAIPPAAPKAHSIAPSTKDVPASIVKREQPSSAELSPQKAKKLHRAWRSEIRDRILDLLTDPTLPISGQDYSTLRTFGYYFKIGEPLDKIESRFDDKPDMRNEAFLFLAVEALQRLLRS
jgi:hypothetical protein